MVEDSSVYPSRLSLDLLADGSLTTQGFITDEVPAERAAQVYESLADDPGRHLGVALDWRTV